MNWTDATFIRATSIFDVPAHDKTTGKSNCIMITVGKGRLKGGDRMLHGSGCREANRGPGYFYLCIFVLTCIDPKAYFDNSNKFNEFISAFHCERIVVVYTSSITLIKLDFWITRC